MNTRVALYAAAGYAATQTPDARNFRHGALGIRQDGAKVFARNAPTPYPCPEAHAEARLVRKMGGGIVYVARVLQSGLWALSKPCPSCLWKMRARGITKVYYTIAPEEYACIWLR